MVQAASAWQRIRGEKPLNKKDWEKKKEEGLAKIYGGSRDMRNRGSFTPRHGCFNDAEVLGKGRREIVLPQKAGRPDSLEQKSLKREGEYVVKVP